VRKHLVTEWIKDQASSIVPWLNSDEDDSNDDNVKDEAQPDSDQDVEDSDSTG